MRYRKIATCFGAIETNTRKKKIKREHYKDKTHAEKRTGKHKTKEVLREGKEGGSAACGAKDGRGGGREDERGNERMDHCRGIIIEPIRPTKRERSTWKKGTQRGNHKRKGRGEKGHSLNTQTNQRP